MESRDSSTSAYLRMDLAKSDLFLEILSFLEGVNQFLGNDFFASTEDDKQKLGEQRKSLHAKSNYLWQLFNMSINEEHASYLNMGTNKKEEQDQTYDYCSFETDFKVELKECPFLTMGATEMVTKGPKMEGELIQIERRSFFGKPKSMYVILIEKWMLIYPSKADKKPIQCIYIKRVERIPEQKHSNAFKIHPASDEKASDFQCSTPKQANDWIKSIEDVIKVKNHGYVNVNSSVSTRKLPTPPVRHRKSNKSDDIYEEPDLVNARKSTVSQIAIEMEKVVEKVEIPEIKREELTYDNVDHGSGPSKEPEIIKDMPHIPVKLNSFKPVSPICPNYDVPRNNRLVCVEKPEEPKKIELPSPSHSRSNSKNDSCSVVQNTEEIKEKLRQQGIILTPIKTHPASSKSKFSLSPTKDIKNWFKTKMNKADTKEKRKSASETLMHSTNVVQDELLPKPLLTKVNNNNGSKVNMIIHQLEANGHLKHLLTKTKVQRRHTVVDDSYEFVSSSSQSKEVF